MNAIQLPLQPASQYPHHTVLTVEDGKGNKIARPYRWLVETGANGLRARGEYQGADGRWRELANSARLGELLAMTPRGSR